MKREVLIFLICYLTFYQFIVFILTYLCFSSDKLMATFFFLIIPTMWSFELMNSDWFISTFSSIGSVGYVMSIGEKLSKWAPSVCILQTIIFEKTAIDLLLLQLAPPLFSFPKCASWNNKLLKLQKYCFSFLDACW